MHSIVGDWNTFTQNMVPEVRTHNAAHEVVTVGVSPVLHDVKGHLTTNTNTHGYSYDFDNRSRTIDVNGDQVPDYENFYDAFEAQEQGQVQLK